MWLGRANESIVGYGWSENPAADLREAVQSCLKGIKLDDKDSYGHYALAMSYLFCGDREQSIQACETALGLVPTFALAHLALGLARLYAGDAAGAIAPLERGLRLNPLDAQNFLWFRTLSLAYYFTGDPTKGVQARLLRLPAPYRHRRRSRHREHPQPYKFKVGPLPWKRNTPSISR